MNFDVGFTLRRRMKLEYFQLLHFKTKFILEKYFSLKTNANAGKIPYTLHANKY